MAVIKRLTLQIPGSISNLGPGFDSLALALKIYCKVTVTLLEKNDPNIPFISFKGAVAKRSESDDIDDLLYKVLKSIWKGNPDLLRCIRMEIESEVPLGCGLGGSSAAILGALWGSYVFQDRIPNPPDLLAEVSLLEGHSEGFSASLLGDFIVCARSMDGERVIAKQMNWPERWKPIFLIPSYRRNTEAMRSCLPEKVPLSDAAFNIQRSALLVSAVVRDDDSAIKEALHDKLHESYRSPHVPLLARVRAILGDLPVLGSCLSGAGPSAMVLVTEKHRSEVFEALKAWAETEDSGISVLAIDADREGLRELSLE
ncbi:MAG: homoserine kinase [Candidatus Obscuribacterales bacterium]|nr:homoserine kinase [Candidatus Obscuribacterales bacterium]